MGLLLSSNDNPPTITPLGSHVKAISTLPIPLTVWGIKSFIGCVIYLAQFLPKLSELIKPINDILKNCNKVDPDDKIQPLPLYAKGKGKGRKRSPNIQKYWLPIHDTNFEAIKSLIVQAPVLHLPACTGRFYLGCDSSAKHVGLVLYQKENGTKHVITFYSATMPDAACRYSSSELELCGLKKLLMHFQYLLKYFNFTALMDHSARKRIYCSCNLQKRSVYRKFWKKFQIFLSIFNIYLANTCSCLTFFHAFLQTTMMKSQYLISRILHYSITSHAWHSWTLSTSLTITRVSAYVHLIHFQLQGHRRNCRKCNP